MRWDSPWLLRHWRRPSGRTQRRQTASDETLASTITASDRSAPKPDARPAGVALASSRGIATVAALLELGAARRPPLHLGSRAYRQAGHPGQGLLPPHRCNASRSPGGGGVRRAGKIWRDWGAPGSEWRMRGAVELAPSSASAANVRDIAGSANHRSHALSTSGRSRAQAEASWAAINLCYATIIMRQSNALAPAIARCHPARGRGTTGAGLRRVGRFQARAGALALGRRRRRQPRRHSLPRRRHAKPRRVRSTLRLNRASTRPRARAG